MFNRRLFFTRLVAAVAAAGGAAALTQERESCEDKIVIPVRGIHNNDGRIVVELNGKEIAELIAPHLPEVVKRYGLS